MSTSPMITAMNGRNQKAFCPNGSQLIADAIFNRADTYRLSMYFQENNRTLHLYKDDENIGYISVNSPQSPPGI